MCPGGKLGQVKMKETIKPLFTHWDIVSRRQNRKKVPAFPMAYFPPCNCRVRVRWKQMVGNLQLLYGPGGQGETWRWLEVEQYWILRDSGEKHLQGAWIRWFSWKRYLRKPWTGPSPQPRKSLNGDIGAINADMYISAIQEHWRCGSVESLTAPPSRLCTKSCVRRAAFQVKTILALIWA